MNRLSTISTLMIFLLSVVVTYQGCQPGFKTQSSSAPIIPLGNGSLSLTIHDKLNEVSRSMPASEDLLAGINYNVVVATKVSRTLGSDPQWTLSSLPESVCSLSNPTSDPYSRQISCDGATTFSLKAHFNFSDSNGDFEDEILVIKNVVLAPELKSRGLSLYSANCATCHNAISSSTKKNKSADTIANAMATNSTMMSLQSLSLLDPTQIRAIALALVDSGSSDVTPPTVAVTSPSVGDTLSGSSSVQVTATDDVAVVGVQLKVDGSNVGAEKTSAPFNFPLDTTLLSNSTHTLSVVARDAAMNTTSKSVSVVVYNSIVPPPDTTPPTVSIAAPLAGAKLVGMAHIVATASDNVAVVGVKAKINGVMIGTEDLTAPYDIPWDTELFANGSYTLTAEARDAAGNTKTSAALTVNVNNPTPPNGAALYTTNCSSCHGPLATSVKKDRTATQITAAIGTTTNPMMNTTALKALTASQIAAISRALQSSADSVAPAISITAPTAGATVSGSVHVTTAASDDRGVVGVKFKVDGIIYGSEVMSEPFQLDILSSTLSNGPHVLTAIARDSAGNMTTSASVSVTVNNSVSDTTPPVVSITSPTAGTRNKMVHVLVNATDAGGVVGVQLKVDGVNFELEDMVAPYDISWDTTLFTNGAHTLTATARDAAGNIGTSMGVAITLNNPATYDGAALYATNCASCHGTLVSSAKLGATVARITAGIATVSPMKSVPAIVDLTSAEIAAIAKALEVVTTNSFVLAPLLSTYGAAGDKFLDIFGTDGTLTADDTKIGLKVSSLIRGNPLAFGGPCHEHDEECPGKPDLNAEISSLPQGSAIRFGLQIRTCQEVLELDRAVVNTLTKVGLTTSSPLSATNVKLVYDLFYTGRPPSDLTVGSIVAVATKAQTLGFTAVDVWRFTILPMCTSAANGLY